MKKIVIIGAGPAGITAAVELSKQKGYEITVLEATDRIGGISQTVQYNGNRMDIGGHRFFSKDRRVTAWWDELLPLQAHPLKTIWHSTARKSLAKTAPTLNRAIWLCSTATVFREFIIKTTFLIIL